MDGFGGLLRAGGGWRQGVFQDGGAAVSELDFRGFSASAGGLIPEFGGIGWGVVGQPANFGLKQTQTPGLTWDTSTLASNGTIRVVTVPGPAAALLGGCGLFVLFRRRRNC